MKKRKVKLFASIASLGLVVAVMGVGVWAATQQAVKVSSQVSFVATSVAADITLQVHNNATLVGQNPGDSSANGTGFSTMDIVEEASMAATKDKDGQPIPADSTAAYLYDPAKILTNTGKDGDAATAGTNGVEQYVARFVNDTAKTFYENRVYLKIADKDEDGYLNVGAQVVYEFVIKAHSSSAPIYYELTANLLHTQIPGTNYYLDDVFDVTVTDQYNPTFTNTTDGEIGSEDDPLNQVMITNWTGEPAGGTTADQNAIQPSATGGKKQATVPENLTETLNYTYGEERRITVVYTVRDVDGPTSDLYQGISYTMTSLQLGDIYIKVANNGKNLNGLPAFGIAIDKNNMDKKVDWITDKTTNRDGVYLDPDKLTGQDEG